jgi:hypothetical protein
MLQPRTILDPAVKSGCGYVIGLARWYCLIMNSKSNGSCNLGEISCFTVSCRKSSSHDFGVMYSVHGWVALVTRDQPSRYGRL